jgi:putative aldouronate transport system permease protein
MVESKRWGNYLLSYLNWAVLIIIAGIMIFPFLYVFAVSFSTFEDVAQGGILLWPKRWSFDAYEVVLQNPMILKSLSVSIFLVTVGTFVKLAFTTLMAYALASKKLMFRRFFIFMVLVPILFWPGIIPRFLIVKEAGLLNTVWALIIPSAIQSFYLLVMMRFFQSLPDEIFDSAELDGANDLQILIRIVMPLSKPILAAIGLFYAVNNWNLYFPAILYITDSDKWPLQVIMRQIIILGQTEGFEAGIVAPPFSVQMATVIVATIPIILVYPLLQRYFISGALAGALKG